MKHENRFVWFDLIRGISALAVCAGHLRAAMFIDFSQLTTTNIVEKFFYFATGLGHQAVMVFFVLSGFFVGGSVLSRSNKFEFDNYLLARLSRLWVVLLPALIFTFFIDQITNSYFPQLLSGEHYSILSSGPRPNAKYSTSLWTFLANITFLQNIYAPIFGTNGPLWSLANEFWYYMLFPLLIIAVGQIHASLTKRVICGVIFILIAFFIAHNLLAGFVVWLLGVPVYFIYSRKTPICGLWFVVISIILFIGSLLDSKTTFIQNTLPISSDLIVGFFFSLFLISIKDRSVSGQWINYIVQVAKWLSEISYTLYLFHFPVVLLIYSFFYSDEQVTLDSYRAMQYILWLIVIVIGSYILWWIFEKNTSKVRQYLKSHLIG